MYCPEWNRGKVDRFKPLLLSNHFVSAAYTGLCDGCAPSRIPDNYSAAIPLASRQPYNRPMQLLSISRRRIDQFPPEAFTVDLVNAEAARVRALYASGLLRQVWKRSDMPGAAILWEAGDEAEVRAALASLPIAEAGMLEVVALIPLEPYPGFAPPV
jgi:muconolactone delta-isomerase